MSCQHCKSEMRKIDEKQLFIEYVCDKCGAKKAILKEK